MYRQLSTNSIIPVVAKVFERIIYNQLSLSFSENSLLNNCQSGFNGPHSTVTALFEAANEWARIKGGYGRLTDEINVHNLLLANKLTVNVDKKEYMLIGSRQRLAGIDIEPIINIGGKNLRRVSKTKSLGILIDENLNCNNQIDNISKKTTKGIGILRRAKKYISQQSLLTIYQSLVKPYFDYCSLVWGNCNQTCKDKLQKLHNRAARVITGE